MGLSVTLSVMDVFFDSATEVAKGLGLGIPLRWRCLLLEDVRRDALHTILFDNRHQTHFNVVHGWVGPKGAQHWAGSGVV